MIKKQYEIIDGPKGLALDEYLQIAYEELKQLLENSSHNETAFQSFFEENPICMPGAFELIGTSGHGPHNSALICQPKIGNLAINRYPDFMWLAQDSTNFCPVLIEIERPDKKLFTQGRQPSADFTQALNQIHEWKSLLNKPNVINDFYDCYDIPDYLRKKNFSPQYCLIYGRRNEYDGNEFLNGIRAQLTNNNEILMSYDRILDMIPNCIGDALVSCTVREKEYEVSYILPVFKYRPGWVNDLCDLKNFRERIDYIRLISDKRKQFLNERYPYWVDYARKKDKGLIHSSDAE